MYWVGILMLVMPENVIKETFVLQVHFYLPWYIPEAAIYTGGTGEPFCIAICKVWGILLISCSSP